MKIVLLKATRKSDFTVEFSVDQSPKGGVKWKKRSEKKRTNLEVAKMQIVVAGLILQGEFASFHPDSWQIAECGKVPTASG